MGAATVLSLIERGGMCREIVVVDRTPERANGVATDMRYGPEAERPEWMTRSRTFPLLNASGRAIVDMVDGYRQSPDPR